ncbi:hypothetical protein NDU88_005769 [Pleurodeles waltl]|uniref:Uncharacterized protein n=1 Tax=Pleurodeles waltl TaxID=8319 RepID=A0AAV7VJY0_PLEWA|nr:hypothetical protein NDU88_005769 [Pleurodeles waltl]
MPSNLRCSTKYTSGGHQLAALLEFTEEGLVTLSLAAGSMFWYARNAECLNLVFSVGIGPRTPILQQAGALSPGGMSLYSGLHASPKHLTGWYLKATSLEEEEKKILAACLRLLVHSFHDRNSSIQVWSCRLGGMFPFWLPAHQCLRGGPSLVGTRPRRPYRKPSEVYAGSQHFIAPFCARWKKVNYGLVAGW